MSILVDYEIKEMIESGELGVDPFDPSLINPSSLDIRLGDTYGIIQPLDSGTIDPSNPKSFTTTWLKVINGKLFLKPKMFILAPMLETVKIPHNVQAQLMGKSSLGRLGIANTMMFAGLHDNGFCGVSTMEIFNASSNTIILTPGMKIGQLVFYRTSNPDKDYSKTGRYQNQNRNTGSYGIIGA